MPIVKLIKTLLGSKTAKKKTTAKKTKNKAVKKPKPPKKSQPKLKEKEIGVITHYFGKISVGIIKLKSSLKLKDKIHIKGAHDDFKQAVKSIQHNHKDLSSAKKGLEVGIKVAKPVHQNDKVYKISA